MASPPLTSRERSVRPKAVSDEGPWRHTRVLSSGEGATVTALWAAEPQHPRVS